jgi:MFS family permease
MRGVGRPVSRPEPVAHVDRSDGLWAPERRTLTLGLILTVTLVAFEALAVSAVMPVVVDELGDLALYGWAFSAFFLGSLIGIVAAGTQIDRHGLARPFAIGLGLFAVGLLAGGLAPSMSVLVVGRAIQGVGAGAIPPVTYVAIGRSYPEASRPRMFAALSSAWVIPGLVGPALAGIISDTAGWRLVFLGLIPILALAGLLALPSLRPLGPVHDTRSGPGPRARLLDAAAITTGAGALLAAATLGPTVGAAILLLVGLAVGLPALVRLLPRGTLRARRGLPSVILIRGVGTFAFFGAQLFLPLALVSVRGTSVTEAGIALTAATLSWTAGSWIQAHQMARLGAPRLIGTGFACVIAGIAGMATVLVPAVPIPMAIAAWMVAGLGMGLAYAPISMLVLSETTAAEQGAATSAMQLSDVLGSALGSGLGGAIVGFGAASGWPPATAIAVAFGVAFLVGVGGVLLSRRLVPHDEPPGDRRS